MNELEKITVGGKKIAKGIINYAGILVSVCLMFAVIIIVTTDVKISSFADLADLGMDFFLLLFCAYAAYVSCADSGMRAGLASEVYTDTFAKFTELKERLVKGNMQCRLGEFCREYILDDLKNVRMSHLAVAGFSYEQYLDLYATKSDKEVDAMPCLSPSQKKAIKKANKVKPINFRPEEILRHGRALAHRSPLEMSPDTRKTLTFGIKFVQSSLIALGMSIIALDLVVDPSWVVFATVCFKLVSVVYNCFGGYKTGYGNIVYDSVNYMNGQIDLMEQAIQYIEANPTTKTTSETTSEISVVPSVVTTTNE